MTYVGWRTWGAKRKCCCRVGQVWRAADAEVYMRAERVAVRLYRAVERAAVVTLMDKFVAISLTVRDLGAVVGFFFFVLNRGNSG